MNMNDSTVLRFLILFTRLSLFSALLRIVSLLIYISIALFLGDKYLLTSVPRIPFRIKYRYLIVHFL